MNNYQLSNNQARQATHTRSTANASNLLPSSRPPPTRHNFHHPARSPSRSRSPNLQRPASPVLRRRASPQRRQQPPRLANYQLPPARHQPANRQTSDRPTQAQEQAWRQIRELRQAIKRADPNSPDRYRMLAEFERLQRQFPEPWGQKTRPPHRIEFPPHR